MDCPYEELQKYDQRRVEPAVRRAREAFNSDSEFMVKLLEKLSGFLQSDLTARQLLDLVTRLDKSEISPIRYAEGELKMGEKYCEFYPAASSLWAMVKKAYCK